MRHQLDDPKSLREIIARVNSIRAQNPALQSDHSLRFHNTDNDQLLCYSKSTPDGANIIVTVVNLDPHHMHSGWVTLDLDALKVDSASKFQMHDLLTDARYLWQGPRNYVELRPDVVPAHVFRLRKRIRTETDFEYFL